MHIRDLLVCIFLEIVASLVTDVLCSHACMFWDLYHTFPYLFSYIRDLFKYYRDLFICIRNLLVYIRDLIVSDRDLLVL